VFAARWETTEAVARPTKRPPLRFDLGDSALEVAPSRARTNSLDMFVPIPDTPFAVARHVAMSLAQIAAKRPIELIRPGIELPPVVLAQISPRGVATSHAAKRLMRNEDLQDPVVSQEAGMEMEERSGMLLPASAGMPTELLSIQETRAGIGATKERVLGAMATSEVIHLAMHGDGDSLYLAGNSEAEGRLSLAEVQRLQLSSSRLVVMSACKTFRGALSKDGVLGISRAFLAAGVPALVASLWPLDDDDTFCLAKAFYDELCKGRSVASAMQQAVKGMIGKGYQVHAWAPFVVYGRDDESFFASR